MNGVVKAAVKNIRADVADQAALLSCQDDKDLSLDTTCGLAPSSVFMAAGLQPETTLVNIRPLRKPPVRSVQEDIAKEFELTQTIEGARFTLNYTFNSIQKDSECYLILRGSLRVIDDLHFSDQKTLLEFDLESAENHAGKKLALSRLTQAIYDGFIEEGPAAVYIAFREFSEVWQESGKVSVYRGMHEVMTVRQELLSDIGSDTVSLRISESDDIEDFEEDVPDRVRAADAAACYITEICAEEFAERALELHPELLQQKFYCEDDFVDTFTPRAARRLALFGPVVKVTVYTSDGAPGSDIKLSFSLRQTDDSETGPAEVQLDSLKISAPTAFGWLRDNYKVELSERQLVNSDMGVDSEFFRSLFRALHLSNTGSFQGGLYSSPIFEFISSELGPPRKTGIMSCLIGPLEKIGMFFSRWGL